MQVNIASVQFAIQQGAPAQNLRRAEHFIKEAASQADIVVFPEDFVTGPLNGQRTLADYEGRYIRHFQQLAAQYAIDIVPGSIIEGDNTGLYNTTYYIDRTGSIKGRYRKVNLWLPERSYVTPGTEFPVFATRFGNVGLLICWDLMFPEAFRALVRQGVELVFCPSYWCFEDAGVGLQHNPDAEVQLVNALCVARACENEIILTYVNAASSAQKGDGLIGRSQITVPFKGAVLSAQHTHEALLLQTVDTALLTDAENAYEIRADLQGRLRGELPLR